ncbi:hypothetical protein CVT26_008437 [Gymnopilus dilepis]|uniref:C2H2-type domain-containing protein n=1 Tax=Gymnopilus dilepis TaxID=231916 RepID=A0A409XXF2_9AGAR|nr:hypothetical protein CVT26_008437 [Gymnopilus dilepis]
MALLIIYEIEQRRFPGQTLVKDNSSAPGPRGWFAYNNTALSGPVVYRPRHKHPQNRLERRRSISPYLSTPIRRSESLGGLVLELPSPPEFDDAPHMVIENVHRLPFCITSPAKPQPVIKIIPEYTLLYDEHAPSRAEEEDMDKFFFDPLSSDAEMSSVDSSPASSTTSSSASSVGFDSPCPKRKGFLFSRKEKKAPETPAVIDPHTCQYRIRSIFRVDGKPCGHVFTSAEDVVRHLSEVHKILRRNDSEGEGVCHWCLKDRTCLFRHITEKHLLRYHCPIEGCGRSYASRHRIMKHMRKTHEEHSTSSRYLARWAYAKLK